MFCPHQFHCKLKYYFNTTWFFRDFYDRISTFLLAEVKYLIMWKIKIFSLSLKYV